MVILVDADACPVKNIIETLAKKHHLKVLMISNISHHIQSDYAEHIVVDNVSQSADVEIMNRSKKGDIIVTQDYGLASIVLGRGCYAIHPSGKEYLENNIDQLLMQRFVNQKTMQSGGRIKGPKKRTAQDDVRFKEALDNIIQNGIQET